MCIRDRPKRRPGNPNLGKEGEPYRWKPGQSGNPKGRPKGQKTLAPIVRDVLGSPAAKIPIIHDRMVKLGMDEKSTVGEVFVVSVIIFALIQGRSDMIKEVFNRVDGKVAELIQNEFYGSFGQSLDDITDDQLERALRPRGCKKEDQWQED